MRNKRGPLILFFLVLIFGFLYTISQPPAGIGGPLNERSFIQDNGDGSLTLFAYALSSSGDPDEASYFCGVGDGQAENADASWDTCHDALYGNWGTEAETTNNLYVSEDSGYGIKRAFFPVDCTALPDDCTITAAELWVYFLDIYYSDNDANAWYNVVGETTQADPTLLDYLDFDTCGAVNNPTEGATRIDLDAMSDGAYNTWTLNATGRGWIKKSGTGAAAYTRLGMREGHDCLDDPITGTGVYNGGTWRASEYTGTASDPYLKITYTPAGGPAYVPKVILIK